MQGPQILLTQQDAAASFDFTATFSQAAASWDASAAETFTSTATILQAAATWAAVASEAFAATGSFSQAAAAWDAIVAETFASTATWTQAAGSWDAAVDQTSDRQFSATFDQAAGSWDAIATGPLSIGGTGGKFGFVRVVRPQPQIIPIPEVAIDAAFAQSAGGWAASVRVNDDELVLILAA